MHQNHSCDCNKQQNNFGFSVHYPSFTSQQRALSLKLIFTEMEANAERRNKATPTRRTTLMDSINSKSDHHNPPVDLRSCFRVLITVVIYQQRCRYICWAPFMMCEIYSHKCVCVHRGKKRDLEMENIQNDR